MRNLFSFNMMTLDGFFEGSQPWDLSWHNTDDEFNEFAIEQMKTIDTLMFGRKTYEGMAAYWASEEALKDDPIVAGQMNSVPKLVISRTLAKADWNNTRLINDNLAEEILKLKQQPGKDLAIFGSANLLSTLMQMDLVDEHRVMVNPIILGKGNPLFKNMEDQVKLKLLKSRTFNSGNVLLYYSPAKG
jgi:dihydrofolate reductase